MRATLLLAARLQADLKQSARDAADLLTPASHTLKNVGHWVSCSTIARPGGGGSPTANPRRIIDAYRKKAVVSAPVGELSRR
jgi:hypothetical protein